MLHCRHHVRRIGVWGKVIGLPNWLLLFIPLWILGFLIGLNAQRLARFFDEPELIVLSDDSHKN